MAESTEGIRPMSRRQVIEALRDAPVPARRVLRRAYRIHGAPNGDSYGGLVEFMVKAEEVDHG